MLKTIKNNIVWILILLVVFVGGYFLLTKKSNSPNLDSFAKCIKKSGAIFYGAFWCTHCQAQKALFGDSVEFLPYVECSTPDGQGQNAVCKKQKIEGYPTWRFKDGSELSGEIPLSDLAQKTKCALPAGASK